MEASENILRQRSCDHRGERGQLLVCQYPDAPTKLEFTRRVGGALATGVPAFAIKKLSPRDARWIIRLKCAFASAALSWFAKGFALFARRLALGSCNRNCTTMASRSTTPGP